MTAASRRLLTKGPGTALQVFLLVALIGICSGEAAERKANTSAVVIENGVPKLAINGKVINNMFGVEVFSADVNAEKPEFLADMKKAIDRTAALNIPIFSFEILWHDYDHSKTVPQNAEEAAGRFNTANLDAVLDYAAQRGVYVMLELLKHQHWALPSWWKSYKSNSSGSQMLGPPSPAVDVYNREQTPVASFQNPDHHELLESLLKKLILRYRDHPAVFGYGINMGPTGENGYIPNYIDMYLNKSMPRIDLRSVMGDYSPVAVKNFIAFLKRKYPSIDDLNSKWNTHYRTFEEITPPYPRMTSAWETFASNGDDRPSMRDWQTFRHEAIVEEWKFLSGLVRRLDPNKVIMGKTNWSPMAAQTGTEFMQVSSVEVNSQKLIDMDKMDACLQIRDYMPEAAHTSSYSKLDYVHFSRFSKKYGTIRIFNLDNSVKKSGGVMDISIALPAKETLKKEGCYLWFPVLLESDKFPKPDWSWNEIEALVKRSGAEELKGVKIDEPPTKFFFDEENTMPHYYDSLPGLKTSGLAFALSKALFDSDPQPVGFVSSADVMAAPPDPKKTKLLVLTNQRFIHPTIAANLKTYVDSGGTLLLLGSNGIFDSDGRKDASAIRKLAPLIGESHLRGLYEWGVETRIKIPIFAVSKDKGKYLELDISKDPDENFQTLTGALPKSINLPKKGRLIFVSTDGRPTLKEMGGDYSKRPESPVPPPTQAPNAAGPTMPSPGGSQSSAPYPGGQPQPPQYGGSPSPGAPSPQQQYGPSPASNAGAQSPLPQKRNFIKDWDKNGDGVVTRDEFTGDPAVFDRLDLNHDGKITPEEAAAAGE